jgi:hypothetical protein
MFRERIMIIGRTSLVIATAAMVAAAPSDAEASMPLFAQGGCCTDVAGMHTFTSGPGACPTSIACGANAYNLKCSEGAGCTDPTCHDTGVAGSCIPTNHRGC